MILGYVLSVCTSKAPVPDLTIGKDTRRPHNGDGFGVGYYTSPALGPEPCIFTSTIPAWNCINLKRLASKTTSHLIFAHVRAATEGALSETNCHPFQRGCLMWMHNGGIGGWKYVKRQLADSIGDRWFESVQGGTDSEWAFALFLDQLEAFGVDPDSPPLGENGFGHTVLRKAMFETIRRINEFIKAIPAAKAAGIDTRSLLNFAVTDGSTVICTRYVGSKTDEAASLYFSSGTSWKQEGDGVFKMERRDKGADIVLVASEPLTFERGKFPHTPFIYTNVFIDNWVTVPTNSVLTIHKQTVMIHPIIDEFYSENPSYSRSSAFAHDKGLVSKTPAGLLSGHGSTDLDAVDRRLREVHMGCN